MLVPKKIITNTAIDGQVISLGKFEGQELVHKDMNDYSWSEIKDLIQTGHADYFSVGDTKDITLNLPAGSSNLEAGKYFTGAVSGTYKIVVLGINHNSELEGTNRVHFCIGKSSTGADICFYGHAMNSTATNSGGWNGCEMKTWLNDTFYNALPSDLKDVITECTKYTDNTGNKSNTEADVTSTSQKIWLMSEFEVCARKYANQYEQNKQAQYDYYKSGNRKLRGRHNNPGSTTLWWLRSPGYNNKSQFCFICLNNNIPQNMASATSTYGVVPCFTIS